MKQLVEDMARYLYLPRLKNEEVLLEAIRDGISRFSWEKDGFGYAEGWDAEKKRYGGLVAGQQARVLLMIDDLDRDVGYGSCSS